LIEPVEYHTDQVDVAASYTAEAAGKLAYYGSRFSNATTH